MMRVISVNVGGVKSYEYNGRKVETGIYKFPVEGRVRVGRLRVEGDGQADLENHGGEHRAVYIYPHEHYARWRRELGREGFDLGQFGENLTTEGLLEDDICIGDTLRAGPEVVLQVSQPRPPCYKMAMRIGEPRFPKLMSEACLVGFYCRVLGEGRIGAGDAIEIAGRDPAGLSVRGAYHLRFFGKEDREGAGRAAQIEALEPGWREVFRKRAAAAR
ncbi:MAG: MOSC domain-containing protein [Phycisphaerales bacterium JB039]